MIPQYVANVFGPIGDTLGILAVVLGIIGIAGGAVGYFAKARGDSIIEYQAKELDLRDKTIQRLQLDYTAVAQERDTLKEQIPTLTALAQGSPELAKLTAQIKELVEVVSKQSTRGRR